MPARVPHWNINNMSGLASSSKLTSVFLIKTDLPSKSGRGVEVSLFEGTMLQTSIPERLENVTQQQHIHLQVEIVIVSQILHPRCSPNSLSMVVVTLANSQQVEFAAEYFFWRETVLFEVPPIVHILVGMNSISIQQSELFICTTDSEIIKDLSDL